MKYVTGFKNKKMAASKQQGIFHNTWRETPWEAKKHRDT